MGSNSPTSNHLDPHEAAPQELKEAYKSWTGATALTEGRLQPGFLDTGSLKAEASTETIAPKALEKYFEEFLANNGFKNELSEAVKISESVISSDSQTSAMFQATSYEIKEIPGNNFFRMTYHCIYGSRSTAFL
jgi:hypothetical protein